MGTYTYPSGKHRVTSAGSIFTLAYDANGNMTTRTVSGSTYTLGYDAENRLTSVSGAATAAFTFDGNGNRVKSVVGATTTLFVGSHYESSGGGDHQILPGGRDTRRHAEGQHLLLAAQRAHV